MTQLLSENLPVRQWQAHLDLGLAVRGDRTSLVHSSHKGPLRVQRPFYPEGDGTSHIYILHPPGGLVIGDELKLSAKLALGAKALLTTPSAGKIYSADGQNLEQQQHIEFSLSQGAVLEWLPQETIVFNGANGVLTTRVNLSGDAKIFAWDIIRLGRIAGNKPFVSGRCTQKIEICRDGRPLFIEKNILQAGSEIMTSNWGMQSANTLATLFATVSMTRNQVDELIALLEGKFPEYKKAWGITQKNDIFLARFLGNCVVTCREGFTLIWAFLRGEFSGKDAMKPRIWST